MAFDVHTVDIMPGSNALSNPDRLKVLFQIAVPNVAGAGAGDAVVTAIAGLQLPPAYGVIVTPGQDAVAFVSGKTATGFNVTLNPRLAANTLAVGIFDVLVFA